MIRCSIHAGWVWSAADPVPLSAPGAEEAEMSKRDVQENEADKMASHLAAER